MRTWCIHTQAWPSNRQGQFPRRCMAVALYLPVWQRSDVIYIMWILFFICNWLVLSSMNPCDQAPRDNECQWLVATIKQDPITTGKKQSMYSKYSDEFLTKIPRLCPTILFLHSDISQAPFLLLFVATGQAMLRKPETRKHTTGRRKWRISNEMSVTSRTASWKMFHN